MGTREQSCSTVTFGAGCSGSLVQRSTCCRCLTHGQHVIGVADASPCSEARACDGRHPVTALSRGLGSPNVASEVQDRANLRWAWHKCCSISTQTHRRSLQVAAASYSQVKLRRLTPQGSRSLRMKFAGNEAGYEGLRQALNAEAGTHSEALINFALHNGLDQEGGDGEGLHEASQLGLGRLAVLQLDAHALALLLQGRPRCHCPIVMHCDARNEPLPPRPCPKHQLLYVQV